MKLIRLTVAAGALLLAGAVWAADSGTLLKDDDVKAEPFNDARTVAKLRKGAKVEIQKKEGGWFQVKAGKKTGWMHMLSVRKGGAAKGSQASGLLGLASGRAGTGKVVSTTGIRGLNEEELKAARFDEAELKRAESYAASREQSQQFAQQGGLVARQMDYLPAPK